MYIPTEDNNIQLLGTVLTDASFSHRAREREYLGFSVGVKRLSGAIDTLNAVAPSDTPGIHILKKGERVRLAGEVRSHNNKTGIGNRLLVFAYIRAAEPPEEGDMGEDEGKVTDEDYNRVSLKGALCKPPIYRKTPLGREICDALLAVRRGYGRADYLPVIFWGKNARDVSDLSVGDAIKIEGRLQSRDYIKETDSASIVKTAVEISAYEFVLDPPSAATD